MDLALIIVIFWMTGEKKIIKVTEQEPDYKSVFDKYKLYPSIRIPYIYI